MSVSEPEAHSTIGAVLFTGDELERDLLHRGVTDLFGHPVARQVDVSTDALLLQAADDLAEVLGVLLGYGDCHNLHGREPHGEGSGVVLEQNREEPLDGSEQRAVDHHGLLTGSIGGGVLELKTLGLVEVELHGGELPGATDGVSGLHGNLRAVERGSTGVGDELEAGLGRHLAECLGRVIPCFNGSHKLLGVAGGQLKVEVRQSVTAQGLENELELAGDLGLNLLGSDVHVRVVLGKATHTGEAGKLAALLVAVDGTELGEAQREFTVAASACPVDQVVHRAVHGLEVVVLALAGDVTLLVHFLVQVHGREHPVLVPLEVAAGLKERGLGDVGRVNLLVAVGDETVAHVVLDFGPDDSALGVEDRESGTDLVGEREQVEVVTQLAVVALGGLFETRLVLAQLFFRRPGSAVDALQLLVFLRPAPVGRGGAGQRVAVADHPGGGDVGSAAEVLPVDLAGLGVHVVVNREFGAADLDGLAVVSSAGTFTDVALETNQFELVRLVGEFEARFVVRDHTTGKALALLDDAGHGFIDGLDVFWGERSLDVEVVVEAVGDGRTNSELGFGVDRLNGLGHHVGGGVAQDRETVGRRDVYRLNDLVGADRRRHVPQLAVNANRDDIAVGEKVESSLQSTHSDNFSAAWSPCCSARSKQESGLKQESPG